MFKEKHLQAPIRYTAYLRIFNENFHLTFGRPQVDTCGVSENLDLKTSNQFVSNAVSEEAKLEKAAHIAEAKKFNRSLKSSAEESKEDPSMVALAFDYMQNLTLPWLPVQELFHYRKLTVSVFGVHNLEY